MSKRTRTEAGTAVASAFLSVEEMAQVVAADSAKCLAVMIEQRIRAKLPADVGGDVLVLVAEAVQHQVAAANAFADAHKRLAEIRDDLGLTIRGFDGDCDSTPPAGHLSVVRTAA
jgi:hypothetical protein